MSEQVPTESAWVRFLRGERAFHPILEFSIGFALAGVLLFFAFYFFSGSQVNTAPVFEPHDALGDDEGGVLNKEEILRAVQETTQPSALSEVEKLEVLEQVSGSPSQNMSEEEKLQILSSVRLTDL